MLHHAHLNVSFLEELVPHPAAAARREEASPTRGPGARLGIVIIPLWSSGSGHLSQQRLALLAGVKLVVVKLISATATVKIHDCRPFNYQWRLL